MKRASATPHASGRLGHRQRWQHVLGTRTAFPPGAPVISLPSASAHLLNAETPALVLNQLVPAVQVQQIFLAGTSTNIQINDRLLLVGLNCNQDVLATVLVVRNVVPLPAQTATRVDFADNPVAVPFLPASFPAAIIPGNPVPFNQTSIYTYVLGASIDESDLQALMRMSNWDPDSMAALVNNLASPAVWTQGIFSFAAEAAFFEHNAPLWARLPAYNQYVLGTQGS